MWLRNTAKRLITINGPMSGDGYPEFYDVLPGENPAVDVPDALCKSDFVKNLIKIGELVQTVAPESDAADDDLESLRNEALLLGIDVDKKWKAPRIRAEIDKANS